MSVQHSFAIVVALLLACRPAAEAVAQASSPRSPAVSPPEAGRPVPLVFSLEGLHAVQPGRRARATILVSNGSAQPLLFTHPPLWWPRSVHFDSGAEPTRLHLTTSAGSHTAFGTKPICFEGVRVFKVPAGRTLRRPVEFDVPRDLAAGRVTIHLELAVLVVPPDRACTPPNPVHQTITAQRPVSKPGKRSTRAEE